MDVHNIIEDLVVKSVNDIFETERTDKKLGLCTCDQCKLDVACYVLNRVAPEYVVSGRGATHSNAEYKNRIQRLADISVLANEGWHKIDQTKRPHFDHSDKQSKSHFPSPPVFNFPTIIGRLFNGKTFAPMDAMKVSLYHKNELVKMIDPNWQNPCTLYANTGGTYIFWPFPLRADSEGESRVFEFEIRASAPGFEELQHFFSLRVNSELAIQYEFSLQRQNLIQDLMLFNPEEDAENP
jgi:competence protein ComFB